MPSQKTVTVRLHLAMLAVILFPASLALADQTPAPCVTTTLDNYIALGPTGCTVGALLFYNFAYSSKDASHFPASSATVSRMSSPQSTGLQFSVDWGCPVSPDGSCGYQGTVSYMVEGSPVSGENLSFAPTGGGMISDASVVETTEAATLFVYWFGAGGGQEKLSDSASFNPSQQLAVSNNISATNMFVKGFSNGFTVAHDPVPQFTAVVLVGIGLTGLAALRPRSGK
jgi:hypothetical protein